MLSLVVGMIPCKLNAMFHRKFEWFMVKYIQYWAYVKLGDEDISVYIVRIILP